MKLPTLLVVAVAAACLTWRAEGNIFGDEGGSSLDPSDSSSVVDKGIDASLSNGDDEEKRGSPSSEVIERDIDTTLRKSTADEAPGDHSMGENNGMDEKQTEGDIDRSLDAGGRQSLDATSVDHAIDETLVDSSKDSIESDIRSSLHEPSSSASKEKIDGEIDNVLGVDRGAPAGGAALRGAPSTPKAETKGDVDPEGASAVGNRSTFDAEEDEGEGLGSADSAASSPLPSDEPAAKPAGKAAAQPARVSPEMISAMDIAYNRVNQESESWDGNETLEDPTGERARQASAPDAGDWARGMLAAQNMSEGSQSSPEAKGGA
jgi:hypothetical protein